MPFASVLLVIIAALIHATWNLLAKRAAPVGPLFVFAYNLFSCLAYAPWVIWLLARGAVAWDARRITFVLLSGAIHLAYSLSLQRGYQKADLSLVYPVARGTGPLLATCGAILLLGELPSTRGLLGLALVIGGIGLIATQGDLAAFRRPGGQEGVRWGVATGGFIACYTVADAYAVKLLGIAPVVLDWCSNLLRFLVLAPLAIRDTARARAAMRGYWGIAAAVGLLSPLSYILILAALNRGAPLSLVAPMREMSMMVGAVFGMLILREPVGRWRLSGCALLVLGVALLSSS